MPDIITNPDGGGPNVAEPNAGAPAPNTDPQQSSKSKVKFSEEQQAVINELIDKVFAKAFEKGKTQITTEVEPKLTEAQATIEKLNKELADLKAKPPVKADDGAPPEKPQPAKPVKAETPQANPEMQQLLARFEELQNIATSFKSERDRAMQQVQQIRDDTRKTRIKEAFIEASKNISFFDPMEVYALIRDHVDVDEESDAIVVKNPKTNQPRLNGEMEPMSLAEYLAEFAKSKPYMVRASGADGGTGATGSVRLATGKAADADAAAIASMSNEEFEAYRNRLLQRRR